LCTTLCLQWEPEIIAISLIYLACKLSKLEIIDWQDRTPNQLHWWDMFVEGLNKDLIEDICHQILDVYSIPNKKTPPSLPCQDKSIVPKKVVPSKSSNQKLLLQKNVDKYMLTSEQEIEAAINKHVKLMTTSDTLPAKKLLPMPPGIKPSIFNVTPKPQNIQKPFLPSPPSSPKLLLEQSSIKRPPRLQSTRPPLPTLQLAPLSSLPPHPLAPNQMLMPQGVTTQLLPFTMQPQPYGFLRMNPYPTLWNAAQSYANFMFSLSPNMISSVPGQYHPHETQPQHKNRQVQHHPYQRR
ncbi:cyclin-K-like, partial [Melanaphis sacchari]|uniref:cyclin-K-like n=1 Tax=Melanaphis sacchari TaxID=742174 RepID=UPI000DC1477E